MKKDMISAVAGAVIYALVAGCAATETQLPFEDVEYVKDFPVTYDVRNGSVVETGRIGLLDIMLCGSDTLLIATQDNGGFISAMNLDDGTMSAGFFRQGNGPGELLYAPYFYQIAKAADADGSALVLEDGKGNMLRWKLEGLFQHTQPDIEVINDSVPSALRMLYINDSTYLYWSLAADQSCQTRCLQRGAEKIRTKSMEKLDSRTITVKDGFMFNVLSFEFPAAVRPQPVGGRAAYRLFQTACEALPARSAALLRR